MTGRIQQIAMAVNAADVTHGSLGILAVLNGYWTDYLNPFVQVLITIGGVFYLYYMIRAKRTEWLLNKNKLNRESAEK